MTQCKGDQNDVNGKCAWEFGGQAKMSDSEREHEAKQIDSNGLNRLPNLWR